MLTLRHPTSSLMPALRTLPMLSDQIEQTGRELVVHAASLLRPTNVRLISLTVHAAEPAKVAMTPWSCTYVPDAALASHLVHNRETEATLDALQSAALILLAELIRRWPTFAVPPAVGIITDGTGIAFSAKAPCSLAVGWLDQQCGEASTISTIVPFSVGGHWSRLVPASNNRSTNGGILLN
jgi:hypothetical protein